MPVVGFMHILSLERERGDYAARFRQGLKETGFIEGQNVAVEYRWAQGHYDRLPGLAADLVRRNVDVIAATGGEPSPQVAKAPTQTIPIVFTSNGDPVKGGLVASLNRPGGNATSAHGRPYGSYGRARRFWLIPLAGAPRRLRAPNTRMRQWRERNGARPR